MARQLQVVYLSVIKCADEPDIPKFCTKKTILLP